MAILISGCSSGIGLQTALYLKQQGYNVIATARNELDIHQLQLNDLLAIKLDVNNSLSIESAVSQAAVITDEGIDVLINNAGFGQAGAIEDLSREAFREQFETNVFGLVELTNNVIPYMREQGFGQIINISSILGLVCLPYRGAYCASKYAVEAISDTLRLELADSPIDVSLIEPGPIESYFRQTSIEKALETINIEQSVHQKQYQKLLSEQQSGKPIAFSKPGIAVAKKVLKAIEARKPKARYKVTTPAHVLSFIKRLLSDKQLDFLLRRF